MEDWKAEQTSGQDEVIYTAKPSTEDLKGPTDQHDEYDENIQKPAPRRLSIDPGRVSLQLPLSLSNTHGKDFEDHDASLRNNKEKAHTLMDKECAAEDVIHVWEDISKYIILKMMEGQAVRIAGLGTFALKIHKVPVNQKSVKVTKAPVFILSEHVASMYHLKQDKLLISNTPTTALNLSVIANETGLPRGMIEGILTELLQAFARGIACNKSLEFPFPFIGKLYIRDQKVVMKFYNEFCKRLGFNVPKVPSPDSMSLVENMLPGQMTPLKMHIPTDPFRSVFHLREVRSVHEDSLLVPLIKVDGKYVQKTELCSRYQKNKSDTTTDHKLQCQECNGENVERSYGTKIPQRSSLYKPQKTGDCVLDLMTSCPIVMNECLRVNMYNIFVHTLGDDVVKSHFHRRDNHEPSRKFSYTDIDEDY